MNKTIIYIVLLASLGFGVWYFLFNDKNVFGVDEAGFTIKDTNAIYRIYLADKTNNTINIERKENGWIVNGQYPVLRSSLNSLLKTMATQEAMYPVPENVHNSVITNMAAKAIKVELYNKKGKAIKVFYVGGQVGANSGSYMLIDGASKPYVVQVPGFEGYLTPRYTTDIRDWRDRIVFNTPPEQLKMVSVTYPSEPLNSFVFIRDANGKMNVKIDTVLVQGNVVNQRRVDVFSKFFENMYMEGYLNGLPGIDTVIAQADIRSIIELEDAAGKKQRVDIYWKPLDKRSKNLDVHDPETPDGYDSDRFYAIANNFKDTILIQRRSFDKILRRAFEFYEVDKEPSTNPDSAVFNTIEIPRN